MVVVTVLRDFKDLKEGVIRREGDTFEVGEERAKEIDAKIPGYIKFKKHTRPTKGDMLEELSEKTNPELAEMLGKEEPKKAKKKATKKE